MINIYEHFFSLVFWGINTECFKKDWSNFWDISLYSDEAFP